MYFCYVDESGDVGAYNAAKPDKSGSPFFILTGLIVPVDNWKNSLDYLKSFRKTLAAQAYLPYDVEFHCSELIDTHKIKEYLQLSITDRWKLIDRFAEVVGTFGSFNIISVVIDKTKTDLSENMYLTSAINRLYQLFDEFLKKKNAYGSVLFDRASEGIITTHIRKLMNTGSSGQTIAGIRIGRIVEDPVFRVSRDSIFIQTVDMIAYTLKEKEFPKTSRKKFNADKIFDRRLIKCCFITTGKDSGINFI